MQSTLAHHTTIPSFITFTEEEFEFFCMTLAFLVQKYPNKPLEQTQKIAVKATADVFNWQSE